jgi:hypothetical protein
LLKILEYKKLNTGEFAGEFTVECLDSKGNTYVVFMQKEELNMQLLLRDLVNVYGVPEEEIVGIESIIDTYTQYKYEEGFDNGQENILENNY